MTAMMDVQAAIYQKLTGDTSFMNMVEGVFDDVPDNQKFPYITIGEATEVPFNTFDKIGKEETLTIHIWSQYKGFKEALNILKRMNLVLDGANLDLNDHTLVLMQYEDAQTIIDSDGKTRHVPVTYRVITQEG